ncbi:MAG: mannitol dehydrogenase family protein [Henriciella sp.]
MKRLSSKTVGALPALIEQSDYDRKQPAGIVHIGLGAFHRAHQASYFDALMATGERDWMITGASLRRPQVADQMNPQDGLFTLCERSGAHTRYRMIRSVQNVIVAPDDPSELVRALAAPETALVTLTITEKGYCLDPAIGALMIEDPAIAADLENIQSPSTAPGFLVAGLAARRAAGITPFTILSCDNIPENGLRTKRAVLELARQIDPDLATWIEAEAAFPSSMVDRIVPATTPDDLVALEQAIGLVDEAMVKTEPFTQWVVEDTFCNRRPPLERVGVQMTKDVAAWEAVKLRLLNAAHSALAYLGALGGYEYVHTAMSAPEYASFIDRLWDEAQSTLAPIAGFDPTSYRQQLVQRFLNSALEHRTRQIATDGSQKVPQRFLASIQRRREMGLKSPALILAVAAWIRWQFGEDEHGAAYQVDDPLAVETRQIVEANSDDAMNLARAMAAFEPVFADQFADDQDFIEMLGVALQGLMTSGAAATIREDASRST